MRKLPTFPHIKTHSFRGIMFRILWRRYRRNKEEVIGTNLGYCDHRESPYRKMHIYPSKDLLELLLTLIHEVVHACFPDLDDGAVEEFEQSLGRLLRRMGAEVKFNALRESAPKAKN